MQRIYTRINWENEPSTASPINETNLNKMDSALYEIDGRVVTLDAVKANQSDLLASVKSIDYDDNTGVFVFTWWNGTTKTIDLNIEKIPVSFSMDANGVITMTTDDGTTYTADVGALIKTYTFTDSDTIDFTVTTDASGNKTVVANILDGSVTENKLQPNFLADVKSEVSKAELASANAEDSAEDSESWAVGQRNGADVPSTDPAYHNNAKYYAEQSVHTTYASLTDVQLSNLQNGESPVYDSTAQKWKNGRAKGVGIVADVNSSGTVHGADWLYYEGTTTVITPDSEQMYRVTINNVASLWYWSGTEYLQLASSGGGGGTGNLVDITTNDYNALTPAQKADPDTWYWINDMDGLSGSAIVVGAFADLTDVNLTNPQNGQVMTYRNGMIVNEDAQGGVDEFVNLTDVNIVNPQNGQIVVYRNGMFANENNPVPVLEGDVWIPQTNLNDYYGASSIVKPQGYGQTLTITMNAQSTSAFYSIVSTLINTTAYRDSVLYCYIRGVKKYLHPLTSDSTTQTITATFVVDVSDAINVTTTSNIYMKQSIFTGTSGFGVGTVHAVGNRAIALGTHNVASGNSSFAIGSDNVASKYCAHAEGLETTASGNYSHAEGQGTIASGSHQHVSGKWNVSNSNMALIIGNGIDGNTRSNALDLDWSGNLHITGKLEADGNNLYKLYNGTEITSGTDLDTLTSMGTYTKMSQSFKATNEPSELAKNTRYNLIVQYAGIQGGSSVTASTTQILYAHTAQTGVINVYVRGMTSSYGVWSAWKNLGGGSINLTTTSVQLTNISLPAGGVINSYTDELSDKKSGGLCGVYNVAAYANNVLKSMAPVIVFIGYTTGSRIYYHIYNFDSIAYNEIEIDFWYEKA